MMFGLKKGSLSINIIKIYLLLMLIRDWQLSKL